MLKVVNRLLAPTETDGGSVDTKETSQQSSQESSQTQTQQDTTSETDTSEAGESETVGEELPEVQGEKIPIGKSKERKGIKPDMEGDIDLSDMVGDGTSSKKKQVQDDEELPDTKGALKKEEKKKEEKKEEEKVQQTQQQQSTTQGQQQKVGRDYSIFKPEHASIIKKYAPNQLFDLLKSELPKAYQLEKENKELQQKYEDASKGLVRMPESYAEHPNAYILTPEYSKYRSAVKRADDEASHWIEQLEKIENGEEWQDIVGRNEDGSLKLTDPIKSEGVQAKHKVAVQQALNKVTNYREQFATKMEELKSNHVISYKKAKDAVTEECKARFPWLTNDKMMEQHIEVEIGKPTVSIKDTLSGVIALVDPRFRAHPMTEMFANLVVANLIASQKIRVYESQLKINTQIKKDDETAEPSSKGKAAGAKKVVEGGNTVPSTDDMDE
jgi:hypothetical protein